MFKKSLLFVLCALTLGSCSFSHIMSEDEYNGLDKATLDFDIDWSELDEKPTGMTLYFFPCDDNPIDTTIYHYSYNKVDHVRVFLPEQDYAVICINRSESEFADLKFDFSSFEDACVLAKEESEIVNTKLRSNMNGTRAYNAIGTLKPSSFGSASKSSVKKATRAYNAIGTLKPIKPIKGMSLTVHVFGLNKGVTVSGSISNLSAGVSLKNQMPLKTTLNQKLDADNWKINLPAADSLPGAIECSFGTFGVPLGDQYSDLFPTRGEADTIEVFEKNILELVFKLPDGDSAVFQKDVTEQVRKEFVRVIEEQNEIQPEPGHEPEEMEVELGKPDDLGGSNDAEEDGETTDGTLILHKTKAGFNVKIDKWETNTISITL